MGRHDRRYISVGQDSSSEGHQLDLLHLIQSLRQDGQLDMGVDSGVSMSWEMLAYGHNAGPLQPPYIGASQPGNEFRIAPVRAITDHRVGGVVVHVENRRQVHVEAHRAELLSM